MQSAEISSMQIIAPNNFLSVRDRQKISKVYQNQTGVKESISDVNSGPLRPLAIGIKRQ
jgi:hypothetical protein